MIPTQDGPPRYSTEWRAVAPVANSTCSPPTDTARISVHSHDQFHCGWRQGQHNMRHRRLASVAPFTAAPSTNQLAQVERSPSARTSTLLPSRVGSSKLHLQTQINHSKRQGALSREWACILPIPPVSGMRQGVQHTDPYVLHADEPLACA